MSQPYLAPGALLAIPRSHASSVVTTTIPGAVIKQAMVEYGAYIVDDTASDSAALIFEDSLSQAFKREFNLSLDTSGGPWYDDLLSIFQGLHVVVNNNNESVGGGGTPGVDLAPPICSEGKQLVPEEISACSV